MAHNKQVAVYVTLLRAVNLGGHGQVSMAALRSLLADLGFTGVKTLLNSGNLVFSGEARSLADIEALLEEETARRLDLRTDYLVRTVDEWATIIAGNPFPHESEKDPSHLLVVLLKTAPDRAAVEALQSVASGPEVVRAEGRHLYITYPAGIARSRLTITVIESKLGTAGTGRNWNTVLKLYALAQA